MVKIASWNVNGIRAITKKGALVDFLQNHSDIDILCLQEVRADHATAMKLLHLLGFPYIINYSSQTKKGYSGTAILSKTPPLADITHSAGFTPEAADEGRITAAEFPTFVLVSVYTPNSGQELVRLSFRTETWDVKFAEYINNLKTTYPSKNIIVMGDLNVAHLDMDIHAPKTNHKNAGFTPQERASYTSILSTTNMTDAFRTLHPTLIKYSYWSNFGQARAKNKGWLIDRAIVSDMSTVRDSMVLDDVLGSDHAPITLTVQ